MQKWEYEVYSYQHSFIGNADDMITKLNELGEEGWESYAVDREENRTNYFLKRPYK